ncbi:hypothetical protein M2140_000113 [Clostridiales Family XIII bacterium PM5-7]
MIEKDKKKIRKDDQRRYIIVPSEIWEKRNEYRLLLPIFVFLQTHRRFDEKVTANMQMLMGACGFSYENKHNRKKNIEEICTTLDYLKETYHIEKFTAIDNTTEVDIRCIMPSAVFIIEMNILITNFRQDDKLFIKIWVEDYVAICNHFSKNNRTQLRGALMLYAYVVRSMFWKSSRSFDTEEELCMYIDENPEYFRKDIQSIADDLNMSGMSKSTIGRLLKLLESAGALHHRTGYVITKKGTVSNVGTVMVRHTPYWERELDSALHKELNKRRRYKNAEN